MYSNAHLTSALGVTAVVSGWTVAGYVILGAAVVIGAAMTLVRLARRN
jgi:hypothetical protein